MKILLKNYTIVQSLKIHTVRVYCSVSVPPCMEWARPILPSCNVAVVVTGQRFRMPRKQRTQVTEHFIKICHNLNCGPLKWYSLTIMIFILMFTVIGRPPVGEMQQVRRGNYHVIWSDLTVPFVRVHVRTSDNNYSRNVLLCTFLFPTCKFVRTCFAVLLIFLTQRYLTAGKLKYIHNKARAWSVRPLYTIRYIIVSHHPRPRLVETSAR